MNSSSAEPYPFCVLVVDEEAGSAATLTKLIRDMGHDAHAAHDHREALRLAKTLVPHVVLLTVEPPLAAHQEVTRNFRAIPDLKESYIIAMTDYDRNTNRPTSIAAGFDDHLWKPVGSRLLEALMSYLALKLRSVVAQRPEGGCANEAT